MSESINFGNVTAATSSSYLEPGMYRLKVDPTATKVYTPQGKTPYLSVKFVSEKGGAITEKFFLTAKALPRLQYLHEAWFGKKLDKSFKSYEDIGEYFRQALTIKIVSRPMMTGGKVTADGKFYSGLPYTGFVVAEEYFEEGAFDTESARYKSVVTVEKPNPAVANNNSAILPEADDLPSGGYAPVNDESDPW